MRFVDNATRFIYNKYENILAPRQGIPVPVAQTEMHKNFMNIAGNPYGVSKIVLQGGGAKGVIYSGVVTALFVTGGIFYLDEFVGTSAGAITACGIACITPSAKMYKLIKNKSLREIVTKYPEIYEKYKKASYYLSEEIKRIDFGEIIDSSFLDNLKKIHDVITAMDGIKTISDIIIDLSDKHGLVSPTQFLTWYCNTLKTICQIMENGLEQYITETELFTFQQYFEKTGKHIVLVSTDTVNQQNDYFTDKNPKFKALAVDKCILASMAIPAVFSPQIFEDNQAVYFDGGIFNNCPADYDDILAKDGTVAYYNKKVIAITLDKNPTHPYEVLKTILLSLDKLTTAHDALFDTFKTIIDTKNNDEGLSDEQFQKFILMLYNKLETPKQSNFDESMTDMVGNKLFEKTRGAFAKLNSFFGLDTTSQLTNLLDVFMQKTNDQTLWTVASNAVPNIRQMFVDLRTKIQEIETAIQNKLSSRANQIKFLRIPVKNIDTEVKLVDELFAMMKEIVRSIEHGRIFYGKYRESLYTLSDAISNYYHDLSLLRLWREVYYTEDGYTLNDKNWDIDHSKILDLAGALIDSSNNLQLLKEILQTIQSAEDTSLFEKIKNALRTGAKSIFSVINDAQHYIRLIVGSLMIITGIITISGVNSIKLGIATTKIPALIKFFGQTNIVGLVNTFLNYMSNKFIKDSYNKNRMVRLNVMDIDTLDFSLSDDKKTPVIEEGYQKTIKHYSKLLRIQELTGVLVDNSVTYVPSQRMTKIIAQDQPNLGGKKSKRQEKQQKKSLKKQVGKNAKKIHHLQK